MATRPSTVTSRVTRAVTLFSTLATSLDTAVSSARPMTDSVFTVTSSKSGFGSTGGTSAVCVAGSGGGGGAVAMAGVGAGGSGDVGSGGAGVTKRVGGATALDVVVVRVDPGTGAGGLVVTTGGAGEVTGMGIGGGPGALAGGTAWIAAPAVAGCAGALGAPASARARSARSMRTATNPPAAAAAMHPTPTTAMTTALIDMSLVRTSKARTAGRRAQFRRFRPAGLAGRTPRVPEGPHRMAPSEARHQRRPAALHGSAALGAARVINADWRCGTAARGLT
jgi:hypothetical protein